MKKTNMIILLRGILNMNIFEINNSEIKDKYKKTHAQASSFWTTIAHVNPIRDPGWMTPGM